MKTVTTLAFASLVALVAVPARAEEEGAALATALAIQERVIAAVDLVRPAFVGVGGGSGVCITPDGWILTNHHVAGSGEKWQVTFPSTKTYVARRVGTDERGDICLLKVETPPPEGLPYRPLGDSDALRIGDHAIAVGNPYLLGGEDAQPTVTLGIVSAVHRYQGGYSDCIQTDAPINPGNSGGPLFNMAGEVVGINGRVAVRFGDRVNSGVGFALPPNQLKNFLPLLMKGGEVPHGSLQGLRTSRGNTNGRGVIVQSVDAGSDAEKAGFKKGDRILRIGPYEVTENNRYLGIIGTYPAGTEVEFFVERGNLAVALKAPLASRRGGDSAPALAPDSPFLGIRSNAEFEGPGVEIEQVVKGTGAEAAGIQSGDVILEIDGKAVESPEDLGTHIRGRKVGEVLKMKLRRGTNVVEVEAKIGRYGDRKE